MGTEDGEQEVPTQEETNFMEAFGHLTPAQQKAALTKLIIKEEPGTSDATASGSARSSQHETTPVWHETPKLPPFSGEVGKDASFGRWQYEVKCLLNQSFPPHVVMNAVHKSLKSPAAEVVTHLGHTATVQNILSKFQSIYGTVLSGEALLRKFYVEAQTRGQTCAQWSCMLEDCLFQAEEQGVVNKESVSKLLCSRFWSGLEDSRIKEALRHRVSTVTFDKLVVEARSLEEEFRLDSKPKAHHVAALSPQVSSMESKMDMLLKRMEQLEVKVQSGIYTRQTSQQQTEQSGERKCSKCQQIGHLAFGCRKDTDIACFRCKQVGHLKSCCRNKSLN